MVVAVGHAPQGVFEEFSGQIQGYARADLLSTVSSAAFSTSSPGHVAASHVTLMAASKAFFE